MKNPSEMEITPEMRAFAEKSVEQARKAFDSYMEVATKALSAAEGSADILQSGTRELGRTAIGFAEDNVNAAFAFAEKVVRAKDPSEVLRLQSEFVQAQMKAFAEQAKALGEAAGKTANKAAKPHN
jgi:phasin